MLRALEAKTRAKPQVPTALSPSQNMERHQELLAEVQALLKRHGDDRKHLCLADLLELTRRENIALPVDPTHLGSLWVLDRCGRDPAASCGQAVPAAAPLLLTSTLLSPPFTHRRSHSGRITTDDLVALLDLCRTRAKRYQVLPMGAPRAPARARSLLPRALLCCCIARPHLSAFPIFLLFSTLSWRASCRGTARCKCGAP